MGFYSSMYFPSPTESHEFIHYVHSNGSLFQVAVV